MEAKEKIIEYCEKSFLTNGFRRIKMDSIASELKISKKTIYKHFDTKEEIIKSIVKFKMSKIKKSIKDIENNSENSVVQLYQFLNIILRDLSKISMRFLNDLQLSYPHIWEEVRVLRRKNITGFFTRIIKQGKEEQFVKDIDEIILVESIFGIIDNVINIEFISKSNMEFRYVIGNVFEIIFGGILTEKGIKELNKIKGR